MTRVGHIVVLLMAMSLSVDTNAQSRSPRDLEGLAAAGNAALNEGRFGDALDAFAEAAKLAPRDPPSVLAPVSQR